VPRSIAFVAASPLRWACSTQYVDPNRPRGSFSRAYAAFSATRLGRFIFGPIWLGSSIRICCGQPGAALAWASSFPLPCSNPGSEEWRAQTATASSTSTTPTRSMIIASKAGAAQHPAWFHNLRAHPDVTFGGIPLRAIVVSDQAECDRIWGSPTVSFAPYATYRRQAGKRNRTIPIIQLTPRDSPHTPDPARHPRPRLL